MKTAIHIAALERRLAALETMLGIDYRPVTGANPRPALLRIARRVGAEFGFTLPALVGRDRHAEVVLARHTFIWLAREITDASTATIAEFCGGRDHAMTLHACRAITNRMESYPKFAAQLGTLRAKLELEAA